MKTITETDPLSDELLEHEIPCGGILHTPIARSCSRAAVLRSFGHGCLHGPRFKCIECYKIWSDYHAEHLVRFGSIRCIDCGRNFATVKAFSDYRPF